MAEKKIGAAELNIDPGSGKERDLFKWWLASFLFGKRISQLIARNTYEVFMRAGLDTPDKIISAGWGALVKKLDEGGYTRYDESTARRLIGNSEMLEDLYDGRVTNIFAASDNLEELRRNLLQFNGVGPKTVEIFLREIPDPMRPADAPGRHKKAA